jgi:hypothetical protein
MDSAQHCLDQSAECRRLVKSAQSEAEARALKICADERVRAKLRLMISGAKPLFDDLAILRVRLARPDERAIYNEKAAAKSTIAAC